MLLQVIDRKWREHLYEMDYLQEGISLRAYAQRDPVVEYQREGFDMFATMMDGIKEETVGFLFNLDVQVEENPAPAAAPVAGGPAPVPLRDDATVEIRAKGLGRSRQPSGLQYTAPTIDGGAGSGSVEIQQAPALGVGGAGRRWRGAFGSAFATASLAAAGGRILVGRVQRAFAQRALPLRVGEEVQALPRRPRRPRRPLRTSIDGRFALPERAGRRLSTMDPAASQPPRARVACARGARVVEAHACGSRGRRRLRLRPAGRRGNAASRRSVGRHPDRQRGGSWKVEAPRRA